MNISPEGVNFISRFEGFSPNVYPDPGSGGKPYTQGYGSTIKPDGTLFQLGDPPVSKQQALEYLAAHINTNIAPYLNKTFPGINQSQWDALASFSYNCGVRNLDISSLKKAVLSKASIDTILMDFLKWDMSAGHIMKGLFNRRQHEATLFNTGKYI